MKLSEIQGCLSQERPAVNVNLVRGATGLFKDRTVHDKDWKGNLQMHDSSTFSNQQVRLEALS